MKSGLDVKGLTWKTDLLITHIVKGSEYVEWPARRSYYGFLREDVQKQAKGPLEKSPLTVARVTATERTVLAYALVFLFVFFHCLKPFT